MNINIDLFNITDDTINQIDDLIERIEAFPMEVAKESASRVKYRSGTVEAEEHGNQVQVHAHGSQILFDEYGTGFVAPNMEVDGVEVGANTWSQFHGQTMDKWIDDGKNPADYPHNQEPTYVMTDEVTRLQNETETKAKEFFK